MPVIQRIAPCLWFDNQAEEAAKFYTGDKYGASWQVVPRVLIEMMSDPDTEKSGKALKAMLQMKKIDIGELKRAYAG
jgi:predicted 3-demethylubiquinone-9 3-methyltransferase (glyoxalase superfamily)